MTSNDISNVADGNDMKLIIMAPYQNEPSEISIERVDVRNGKIRMIPDHEFTIIPIEWYGVHNWYEKQANDILNRLIKIKMAKTSTKDDIMAEIDDMIQSFYNRRDTKDDIPERTI